MNLKEEILALLREWCDKMIEYTINIEDPLLYGAILSFCRTTHEAVLRFLL